MRILAIHRHFWPDTPPYASILRAIIGRWRQDGHAVRVITAQPSYTSGLSIERRPRREEVDGMPVERLPVLSEVFDGRGGQLADLLFFPLGVAARLITLPRQDVVMCSTAPQVTLGWAVSLAARLRGARFVYHCMDLHPEIGRISGEFSNPLVHRLLAALDRQSMSRAWRIVVLSQDMRASVMARDPRFADKVVVINNFALPDYDACSSRSPLAAPPHGTVRLVFTGNIGRFQGLEHAIDAVASLPNGTPIELVLMGDGKARLSLEERVKALSVDRRERIIFLPHGSPSAAKALMRTSTVGLVSLVPEVVRHAYPSKTATYFREGLPALVVCESDSELARVVVGEGLGRTCAHGDVDAMATALSHEITMSGAEVDARRKRVRDYADREFDEGRVLDRWTTLVGELGRA